MHTLMLLYNAHPARHMTRQQKNTPDQLCSHRKLDRFAFALNISLKLCLLPLCLV